MQGCGTGLGTVPIHKYNNMGHENHGMIKQNSDHEIHILFNFQKPSYVTFSLMNPHGKTIAIIKKVFLLEGDHTIRLNRYGSPPLFNLISFYSPSTTP